MTFRGKAFHELIENQLRQGLRRGTQEFGGKHWGAGPRQVHTKYSGSRGSGRANSNIERTMRWRSGSNY